MGNEKLTTLARRLRPFFTAQVSSLITGGAVSEGPDIDLVPTTGGTQVGRGGDTVLLFDSGGNPIAEYAATQAGLVAALAAWTSGDMVQIPAINITITGTLTIPAGVYLTGMGNDSILTGTITNNGRMEFLRVVGNVTNTSFLVSVRVDPVTGTGITQADGITDNCWVQMGTGVTYGIDASSTNGSYIFRTVVGTDGGTTNIGLYAHGSLVEVNNCRFGGYIGGKIEEAFLIGNTEFYGYQNTPATGSHGIIHTTTGTARLVNCSFYARSIYSYGAYITATGLTLTDCAWSSISGESLHIYGDGDRAPKNHSHTSPAGISYVSGSLSNPPTESELEAICGTPAAAGAGTGFLILDTDTSRIYLAISTGTNYQYSPFIGPSAGTPAGALSGAAGAWCWFADPRAIYYNGYIYYGYISNTGNVVVHQYNNTTQANGAAVVLRSSLGIDDHNNPSLLIRDSDKRIMAWYSAHSGPKMYQRISTNPEDASSWGTEVDLQPTFLGTEFSYPEPVQLTGEANDPIYLFWRNPYDANTQAWWFSKSTDDGVNWAARTQLFRVTNKSPYMKIVQNGDSRIDFLVSDEHPALGTSSIYHFYYTGGNYYKTDGTLIGGAGALPLDETDFTKVYDGVVGDNSWIWDIAIDASNNPVIVFATFVSTSDHRYQYALWTGLAWSINEITAAGGGIASGSNQEYYSGGIVLDQDDPQITYLSKVVSGQWEIHKYVTADGGANWADTAITTGSSSKNIRPVAVRDHGAANIKYLWLRGTYTGWTNYSMSIYGDDT